MKHTRNKITPDQVLTVAPVCRGVTFNLTAQARVLAPIVQALTKINKLESHLRELHGVIGVNEHVTDVQTFFGQDQIRDLEGLERELRILATDTVIDNLAGQLNALIDLHVPLSDKRRTPEQDAEREKNRQEMIVMRENVTHDFLAEFVQGPDTQAIKAESGQQLITAQLAFDNSDSQSDYFHPHAHYQKTLLLEISRKGPRTEKRARAAIAHYPIFNTVTKWEWDADKASLYGYGSGVKRDVDRYMQNGEGTELHWVISFDSWGQAYPIKGYGEHTGTGYTGRA